MLEQLDGTAAQPLIGLLAAEEQDVLEQSAEILRFTFGQTIIKEGQEPAGLYVLLEGKVRVLRQTESGQELALDLLGPGSYFGEISSLSGERANATVRASGTVRILHIAQEAFGRFIERSAPWRNHFVMEARRRSMATFLAQYSAFSQLPRHEIHDLVAEMEETHIEAGRQIVRQGERSGPMFFVMDGRARAFAEDGAGKRCVGYIRKGDFFGELAALRAVERAATVISDTAMTLLKLSPEKLQDVLSRHEQVKKQIDLRIAQYNFRDEAVLPLDFQCEQPNVAGPAKHDPELQEETLEESSLRPHRKRIRHMRMVYQIDEADCGPACLAMVLTHFKRSMSLARIRELTWAGTDGTSLQALCDAACSAGVSARGVKASRRSLGDMPLPAIVHWQGYHWIVLYAVSERYVQVADPALGLRKISRDEFDEGWTGYVALFDYIAEPSVETLHHTGLGWLLPFFKPHLSTLAHCVFLAMIMSVLQMAVPVMTQLIVDKVLVEADKALLNTLMIGMLLCVGFMTVASFVQRYLMNFAAARIDAASLDFLTRKLLALPLSYFSNRRTGDLQRRLEGVRQVREFITQNGVTGITAATQLVAALAMMLVYSPVLTLVFVAVSPAYFLLMRTSAVWLKPLFDHVEEALGKYHSRQIDAIRGIETVKTLSIERYFRESLLKEFHRITDKLSCANLTALSYEAATQMVSFISVTLFLWVGAYQVIGAGMSVGALMAFNALVVLANTPILTLLNLWDNYQFSSVLLNRLEDVFEAEPEQGRDRSALMPVRTLAGTVDVLDLSIAFGPPSARVTILDGVSLHASPGETIAIVGRSGSGKTTLLRALAGLIEPSGGTILYDTIDARKLDHRDLRRQIGFVLQDTYLFDDTIAANIACGQASIDMDRVAWAAHVACIDEFIQNLPLGFETRIGESGVNLSGGQRQRISIARAIYHQPMILAFDEATSALDTEAERAIQSNLQELLHGRTCFIVAHRLSTVRNASRILVLEKGRVVEQGTHEQLLERRGIYFYLCSQQLGGG